MNDTPTNRQAAHEQFQNDLIDAVLQRIEEEVDALIPSTLSGTVRKAILTEVLPNARFGLAALGVEHLQTEIVVRRYVDAAIGTAEFLVNRTMTAKAINVIETLCPACDGAGVFDLFEYDLPCERCAGTGITTT